MCTGKKRQKIFHKNIYCFKKSSEIRGKKPRTLGKGLNNLIIELNQDLKGSLELISKKECL